jgi:CTP synthase
MALTLVTHSHCCPALYGALAASVAQKDDALLMHCAAHFRPVHGADTVQMVAAAGALVPSGLVWYERVAGQEVLPASSVEAIIDMATRRTVVVPWHPDFQIDALRTQLLDNANTAGVPVTHLTGRSLDDGWCLQTPQGQPTEYGFWDRDEFGRWGRPDNRMPARQGRNILTVALLGSQTDQTDVYPATLAALGDAADATHIDLRVRFISALQLDTSLLASVAGIVLPGGSDMLNVPGQIEAARHGLRSMIPTLGLCLGMQSMTTALAQACPGLEQANMAEAAPDAPIKSFSPMADRPGLPAHRLGTQTLRFANAAQEHHYRDHQTIRCNHRFMLDPALVQPLRTAGLEITATDPTGQIVDAIDWPQHPFYKGMQGHPELGSRSTNAHPLIMDFLRAAQANTGTTNQIQHP